MAGASASAAGHSACSPVLSLRRRRGGSWWMGGHAREAHAGYGRCSAPASSLCVLRISFVWPWCCSARAPANLPTGDFCRWAASGHAGLCSHRPLGEPTSALSWSGNCRIRTRSSVSDFRHVACGDLSRGLYLDGCAILRRGWTGCSGSSMGGRDCGRANGFPPSGPVHPRRCLRFDGPAGYARTAANAMRKEAFRFFALQEAAAFLADFSQRSIVTGCESLNVIRDSAGNSTFLPPVPAAVAKPPPAPAPAPIAAPFPPPARPPIKAPTAAPPPVITADLFPLPFSVPE